MKRFIGILFIVVLSFGCGDKKRQEVDCDVFYPLEQAVVVDNLENYIDAVEVVELETASDSYLSNIKKILIDNEGNFIIKDRGGMKKFSAQGKFMFNIGQKGRAKGEYLSISDICLSEDGKSVLGLPPVGDIMRFSNSDGKYIETIKIDHSNKKNYYEIAPSSDNGFFLISSNPDDITDFDNTYFCLAQFDSKGLLVKELLPRKDFVFPMSFATQSYDNSYIIRPQEGDNIAYRVKNGELIPFLKIDFQGKSIPDKYIYSFKGAAFSHIQDFIRSDYYKLPIYFHDTKNYVYFCCVGPGGKSNEFIYFKDSNSKSLRWDEKELGHEPFLIMGSDEQFIYGVLSELKDCTADELKTMSPLKRYILKNIDVKPTDESNPYIIKIRFKNNQNG